MNSITLNTILKSYFFSKQTILFTVATFIRDVVKTIIFNRKETLTVFDEADMFRRIQSGFKQLSENLNAVNRPKKPKHFSAQLQNCLTMFLYVNTSFLFFTSLLETKVFPKNYSLICYSLIACWNIFKGACVFPQWRLCEYIPGLDLFDIFYMDCEDPPFKNKWIKVLIKFKTTFEKNILGAISIILWNTFYPNCVTVAPGSESRAARQRALQINLTPHKDSN